MAQSAEFQKSVRKIIYDAHMRPAGPYAYDIAHTRMGRYKKQLKLWITYHMCMLPGDYCIHVSPGHTCMAHLFEK